MLLINPSPLAQADLAPDDAETFGPSGAGRARAVMAPWPGFATTPLQSLNALAADLGLGAVHAKDETARMGLGAFKALGGAYAVARLAAAAPSAHDHDEPATFVCATAGNHGRSVALGARMAGAKCVTFVGEATSPARADALASLGAQVVREGSTFEESIAACNAAAKAKGWTVVSDTAWPGYEEIPRLVMQGYTVLAAEALDQLAQPPTHVFLQGGVGGLAGAVAAHFASALGRPPRIVVVEPERAACLMTSARAGAPVRIDAGERTAMTMLECYAPSLIAFRILERTAYAFMTVCDEEASTACERLGRPSSDDPAIATSQSGAAGLAGLIRACGDPAMRRALGLDARSRVLVVVSEGVAHLG
ncbi:MAG TPA: diaminopropionate ammonia-lyase [Caulobacteraceae bacterium]|jgi:diaminopropionate ammonia-lyase|nr:diaminopropionate ammonia-lyase [Caulobacteraceae bacterium]